MSILGMVSLCRPMLGNQIESGSLYDSGARPAGHDLSTRKGKGRKKERDPGRIDIRRAGGMTCAHKEESKDENCLYSFIFCFQMYIVMGEFFFSC